MKTNQSRATTFMVTQQLSPDMWDWSASEKGTFAKDPVAVMQVLGQRIQTGLSPDGKERFGFCGIVHDADMTYTYDEKLGKSVLAPKTTHIHVVLLFNKRQDLDKVAKWAGVQPQYVETPHRGKYGRENMLAYLVHAKDSSKHRYSPSSVQTFGTFDYMSYFAKHHEAWDYQRATRRKKQNNVKADWLAKQVQIGALDEEQIMLTDDYAEVYADNMRLISDAILFRSKQQGYKTLQALKNREFELTVIYVTGDAGSGKTVFANQLLDELVPAAWSRLGQKWYQYSAASDNPMDDYSGQEIVFMDDLRPDSMTPSAWLKILDPANISPTGARYHNKMVAPRVIVMTSYMDPYRFFGFMRGTGGANEALDQFIRRLTLIATVVDLDRMHPDRVPSGLRQIQVHDVVRPDEPVKQRIDRQKYEADANNGRSTSYLPKSAGEIWRTLNYTDRHLYDALSDEARKRIIDEIIAKNDPHQSHDLTVKPIVNASETDADSVVIRRQAREAQAEADARWQAQMAAARDATRVRDVADAYTQAVKEDKDRDDMAADEAKWKVEHPGEPYNPFYGVIQSGYDPTDPFKPRSRK